MTPIKLTRLNLMRTRVWDGALWSMAFGMALAGSVSAQAQTSPTKSVAPPVGTGAGFGMSAGADAGANASIGTGRKALNAAAGVRPGAGLVLGQVLEGKLSYEEAWQSGAWTREDLISILQTPILMPGWSQSVAARSSLGQLLVQHGGTNGGQLQAAQMILLPRQVMQAVMQSLHESPPPNVVELYEALLQEKAKQPPTQETWIPALANLGFYYMSAGQPQKAAETWAQGKNYSTNPTWLADSGIEAARAYEKSGNMQQSDAFYQAASQSTDERLSIVAFSEHLGALMERQDYAQAQRLVRQQLDNPQSKSLSQIKNVTALAWLGYLQYSKDDWPAARRSYQQAIEVGGRLPRHQQQFVKGDIHRAGTMLQLVEQWQSNPILCNPPEVVILAGRDKKMEPIARRFLVMLHRDVPIVVKSSDPRLKVEIEDSPWAEDVQPLQFEKQIAVEFKPELLQRNFEAMLTLSSPQFPNVQVRVPVRVVLRDS